MFMLDTLRGERAEIIAQQQQHLANFNACNGAIAILDSQIAKLERAAKDAAEVPKSEAAKAEAGTNVPNTITIPPPPPAPPTQAPAAPSVAGNRRPRAMANRGRHFEYLKEKYPDLTKWVHPTPWVTVQHRGDFIAIITWDACPNEDVCRGTVALLDRNAAQKFLIDFSQALNG